MLELERSPPSANYILFEQVATPLVYLAILRYTSFFIVGSWIISIKFEEPPFYPGVSWISLCHN